MRNASDANSLVSGGYGICVGGVRADRDHRDWHSAIEMSSTI